MPTLSCFVKKRRQKIIFKIQNPLSRLLCASLWSVVLLKHRQEVQTRSLLCSALITLTASALSSPGVEGSLSPVKEDARGMERTLVRSGVVSIRDQTGNSYLLVNNSNAPFALASMSWTLTTGSLNLSTQRSANLSAVSHWSVDLQPPVFFSSPVSFNGYQ